MTIPSFYTQDSEVHHILSSPSHIRHAPVYTTLLPPIQISHFHSFHNSIQQTTSYRIFSTSIQLNGIHSRLLAQPAEVHVELAYEADGQALEIIKR